MWVWPLVPIGIPLHVNALHRSYIVLPTGSDDKIVNFSIPYFGVIEKIWELDYSEFRVHVFKCKWVNVNNGVRQDELGFTLVDLNKVAYMDEPFIMAEQAR